MEISNTQYKNKQGVRIRTKAVECTILPSEGGKMVSLKECGSDQELLAQAEGKIYAELTFNGDYVGSECSAFDDMFPTIDPWYNGEREYADHGEVCRLPHTYAIVKDENKLSLKLSLLSPFGEYAFHKTYQEQKNGGLEIAYEAVNLGEKPLKAIWASHLMLQAEEGREIQLTGQTEYPVEFMFCEDATVAQRGTETKIQNGSELLKSAPRSENGNAYKFYIKTPYHGEFRYGKLKAKCENAEYLGIWVNNGQFKGMYNVAAEFCTGPNDTPGAAEANGADVTIPAGGSLNWKLSLSVI